MRNKIILSGILLFALTGQAQIVQNGLVGHFPLNNASGDDISTVNIDGIATNITSTTGQSGLANTASQFVPVQNSGITAGTNNRSITNAVTVSAWIKTTNTSTQSIVNKYDWVTDSKGYYIEVYQNKAIIAGRDGGGSFIYPGLGTTTVTDGQWHHIVGVVNGNTWQIWVDCNLENSMTTSTSTPDLTTTTSLAIGYYYYGSTTGDPRYFDGSIDEVRIYNRALNATEIDSLCQNAKPNEITETENPEANSLFLYPNPTSDFITLGFSSPVTEKLTIEIYNSIGEIVYSGLYSENINVANLSQGLYIVGILNEEKSMIAKTILSKN